jgi:hypothetical protein
MKKTFGKIHTKRLAAQAVIAFGLMLVVTLPAEGQTRRAEIDWNKLGRSISDILLKKAKLETRKTVAVTPLEGEDKGIYYLGDLIARRIEAALIGSPKIELITRREFDKLLNEDDLGYVGLIQPNKRNSTMKRLKADLLVVGQTTPTTDEVHVDCQIIDQQGRILATAAIRNGLPRTQEVEGLLRWQQLPSMPSDDKVELARLAIDYSFEMQPRTTASRRWVQITDNMHMQTGDRFILRICPQSDCYVYLLLFDSAGKAEVLFPNPSIRRSNHLRGGVLYTFPSPEVAYKLVPPKGVERFWLVASYEPLTELKDLIEKLRTGADAGVVSEHIRREIQQVATRGMAPPPSGERKLASGYSVRDLPPVIMRSVVIEGVAEEEGHTASPLISIDGFTSVVAELTIHHD